MSHEKYSKTGFNSYQQEKSKGFHELHRPKVDTARPPRRGKIVNAYQAITSSKIPVIMVDIQFDDEINEIKRHTYNRSFVLEHSVTDLALLYGDLHDIVVDADGNHRTVEVRYFGVKSDRGIARIINLNGRGNLKVANDIEDFGTILAPAGGGII
jgi:hypothetical protein